MSKTRYTTQSGVEVCSVTTEQMRKIDRIAIDDSGPNLYQMTENAGRSLALLAIETLGESWGKCRVLVLAGGGGNGGGGICAARHLANRMVNVSVCLSVPDRLSKVTKFQLNIFKETNGSIIESDKLQNKKYDVIIDSLIGYGLRNRPEGAHEELITWANHSRIPIISLDVPSGVDATTGETPGSFINPGCTLTLALPKTGLLPGCTGDLYLADIGIPESVFVKAGVRYSSPFGDSFMVRLYCEQT